MIVCFWLVVVYDGGNGGGRRPKAASGQPDSPGQSSSVDFILLACSPSKTEPVIGVDHKQP